jgi:methylenetetrahydrofolate dehydrogenase (NADP+) / methenyltetrahydrofolate cyclohydrolase
MKLLRGKKIADKILADLKKAVEKQKSEPALAVVLIGENKASKIYIRLKRQAAKKVGVDFHLFKFKNSAKEKEIIKFIKKLNQQKKVNGIIIQLPLPKNLNTQKIINAISSKKDADGFHPENIRKFLKNGKKSVSPVFPTAIMKLLESARINLKNKKAVVVANSEIFGKIMESILIKKKAEVRIISGLRLNRKLLNADIIITAVGKPKLINGLMVKKSAIIIDGGIKKIGKKTSGDVDFSSVIKTTGYLSPVPGGVGPVTVACLLENVYRLSLAQGRKK